MSVRAVVRLLARRRGWQLLLLVAGIGLGFGRYSHLAWGDATLGPDVVRVFWPAARGVAAGGSLYGPGLADNKPPGWLLVNLGSYLTGEYVLVVLLVVGAANGVAAVLLYRWLADAGDARVAVVASLLFLLAVPAVGGHHVGSRPLALAFLLAGLVTASPPARGVAVALATLCNAYAALFVPVYLWVVRRDGDEGWPAVASYLASGAAVAGVAFAAVALVWGVDSMRAALYWSYGLPVAAGVATSPVHEVAVEPGSYAGGAWPVAHPVRWLSYVGTALARLLPLAVLAGVGWRARDRLPPSVGWVLPLALAATLAPFLVRAYEQYWVFVLPFGAVLAAVGLFELAAAADEWA